MRLYFIRLIQAMLLLIISSSAFSQSEPILGPASVQANTITFYSINWYQAPDNWATITWNVTGGIILNQDAYTCEVQWGDAGAGHVFVTEDEWGQNGNLDIQIGTPQVTLSPTPLMVDYGGTQQYLYATPSDNYPVTQILWQYSPNGSTGWTTISAATNFNSYLPSTTISQYYRCIVTENGGQYYSNVVQVIFNQLSPGTISLTQQPGYNSVPTITNTPSHGGTCLPGDRTYVWEQSIDDQPWVVIGTDVNYPSGAVAIGRTNIRRKVTCNGVTQASNVLNILPAYTSVDFENLNYVRTIEVHIAGVNTWQQADQLSVDSKSPSTTYMDGLGRPIQEVEKGGSFYNSVWTDLVQPVEYDPAGRIAKKYVPYPSTDNPGKFKSSNVFTQQASFVTGKFGESAGSPTYARTDYDNSPSSMVKALYAAGTSWGGNSVGIKSEYDFNVSTENVHIWQLAYSTNAIPTSSSTAIYSNGTLYKTIVTDEKGKKIINYKDISGNVILKKVQEKDAGSGLSDQHSGWACTYYIYDDLNHLRFIVPPKAVAYLDVNNWSLTQQLVDDLCFVYTYDAKGREQTKKQPGVGESDVVYDQQDRPLFTQDANGRSAAKNQWQSVQYDGLGRVTSTGVMVQAITTAALQTYADNHSGASTITTSTITLTQSSGVADLVINTRQSNITQYVADNSITINPGFTTESGARFIAFINITKIAASNVVVTLPDNPAPTAPIALTQQFYDDYTHSTKPYTAADNALKDPATSSLAMNLPAQPSPQTKGMATTSKVKVITNANDLTQGAWLERDSYFNNQGAVIQVQSDNPLGGTDITSSWMDFTGLIWGNCLKHRTGTPSAFTIISRNVFDRQGKLVDIYKNFNNTFSKRLVSYTYDELGKLSMKTLAPGYTGGGGTEMEKVKYDYNIQGALTGINKDYALSSDKYAQWQHYFGMYLGYDNRDGQFTSAQYNGAITGVIWKSQGDNSMRRYDYTYDNLGRLTQALFQQRKDPGDGWSNATMNLSEYIGYEDANGNIHSMKHLGALPGMTAGTTVDDLVYTYGTTTNTNVNRLSYVHDGASFAGNGQLNDFKDGTNTESTTNDYNYDANGNLIQDLNKGPMGTTVTYNYLNKPVSITLTNKSRVDYVYDASGAKISKTVTNLAVTPNTSTTTQYADEFVYQDGTLQFVLHEEGRMKIITPVTSSQLTLNAGAAGAANVISGKQGVFEYFMKDQVGNTRMVLTEEYQQEKYLATMESANAANEEKVFGKVDPVTGAPTGDNELALTRVDRTSTPWSGNASSKVTELTAAVSTKKVGPNVILKVSAGDKISAMVNYFYYTNDPAGPVPATSDVLTPLISALLGNKASALTKANSSLIQTNLSTVGGDFASFINNQANTGPSTAPKAFLNVIFFDEQFNYIPLDPLGGSVGTSLARVSQANVQAADPLNLIRKAPKNGWVYIYLSNESNQSVYFDDLQVSQEHGRISEENHYYAFGQKITGISTKAFNKLSNSFNFQGEHSEEEESSGWNEFDLRMYDPQIGRWTGPDSYDEFASPYVGMGNDPVSNVDPNGGSVNAGTGIWGTAFGWGLISGVAAFGAEALAGGDRYQALTAFAAGFGAGIGAYYVNWSSIGNAVNRVGNWIGDILRSDWVDLTKKDLLMLVDNYSNMTFDNDGDKENYTGNMFEKNFHQWANDAQAPPFIGTNVLNMYHENNQDEEVPPGVSTVPVSANRKFVRLDAKMTVYKSELFPPEFETDPYIDAAYFEIKATDGVITLSYNKYQIQYEIEALASNQPLAAKDKVAQYHVVTTANGAIGNSVYKFAFDKGINVFNWRPQYRVGKNGPEIRFGYEKSTKDDKGRPCWRAFFTSYRYYGGTKMTF